MSIEISRSGDICCNSYLKCALPELKVFIYTRTYNNFVINDLSDNDDNDELYKIMYFEDFFAGKIQVQIINKKSIREYAKQKEHEQNIICAKLLSNYIKGI
jgi:hypothetical protein